MSSDMCKSCIHHKVCGLDNNIVGDKFVHGNPMFFNNRELFEKYEKWKAAGFPCDDYMSDKEEQEHD